MSEPTRREVAEEPRVEQDPVRTEEPYEETYEEPREARARDDAAAATEPRRDVAADPAVERERAGTEPVAEHPSAEGERRIDLDPSSERVEATSGPGTSTEWSGGLLSDTDRGGYQQRWDDIQVRFIDEPRQCVREADDLVGEVTGRIADRFSSARQDMEQRWEGGNEPTTEELRQAVQRYRDFFQRLVAQ